jgi:trans-aconitate methyltransferase
MITEREHWLSITDDPDWQRNYIADPGISVDKTVAAVVSDFPDNPERILEIGCGYGRLASEVARWYPDAMVTGTDINPHVIAQALPGAAYVCRDNLVGLPVQDAIYSVALFQHLPDDEKRGYVRQAADILRPGGVLRIQFIEGDHDSFCDHWTHRRHMPGWFQQAGLHGVHANTGLVHPQWTWITGIK